MKKTAIYTYLGDNGIITSPVHLRDIYSIKKIQLTAEPYKALTKNGIDKEQIVTFPEEEVELWYEIND